MNGPLGRIIFPLFVLTMWVLIGVWLAQGDWTGLNWLMLGSAAVFTTIIFIEFAAVFSIGYSLCMIVLPAEVLVVRGADLATVLVAGLAILYGLRLLAFVLQRRRAESFAGNQRGAEAASSHVPTPLKVMLFLFVTTLQTFEAMSPYVVSIKGETTPWVYAGAAVMAIGLLVESVADLQKQRAKAVDNVAFVRTGLYARTRHPNYTGEILFQVGLAIAAFGSLHGWWQALAVVIAPAYIVVLMVFSATWGTARMTARHGDDAEYAAYLAGSGLLLPGRGAKVSSSR
jgi:steroid 5-alpha reductase family enzyme